MKSIIFHSDIPAIVESDMPGKPIEHLRALCQIGIDDDDSNRGDVVEERSRRLDQELAAIEDSGMAAYFYILGCVARRAVDHRWGIHLRGIATGSMVLHALGLTRVCPVEFQLTGEPLLTKLRERSFSVGVHAEGRCIEDSIHILSPRFEGNGIEFRADESPLKNLTDQRFRIDFIEDSALDGVAELLRNIGDGNKPVSFNRIPLDDEATFQLINSGKSAGVPHFESWFFRKKVLPVGKPSRFDHLISSLALRYRVATNSSIIEPVVRNWNQDQNQREVNGVELELRDTGGVILYCEQIVHLLQRLGGFSCGEACQFIKGCVRNSIETINESKERFLSAAGQVLGIVGSEELFRNLHRAAKTSEWKCHLAQQVYSSYVAAYAKAHLPDQFELYKEK